jgi:uncharacterized protein (TIGR02172 family)
VISNETLIGRGRIAEVFAWGDDQVLKLFYAGQALDWIKEEARISRLVYETGVATPAVSDVIEVEGRHGIIYGRVHGTSMLTDMSSKPWKVFRSAKMLAKLHASMHEKKVTSLPSQRQNLQQSIRSISSLTNQKKEAILNVLDSLPDDHVLCHGDFHPDNVVVSADGAMIIDWTTASQGNPLADAARTSLILQMGELPPSAPILVQWMTRIGRSLFHQAYLRYYFQYRPADMQEFTRWQLPMTAARLSDGIAEEQVQLLALIDQWLNKSLIEV